MIDGKPFAYAFLISALVLVASDARAEAAPNDQEALALARDAITVDYLSTNFAEAEKKLEQAMALCPGKACSEKIRAQLHRDLGVVYVGGMNRLEDGKAEFVKALQADATIALDADLTTPEIEGAFKAAAESLGIQPAAPARPLEGEAKQESEKAKDAPAPTEAAARRGDRFHTPPREQMVGTPVPIYVESDSAMPFGKVKVRYRPYGERGWKSLEMSRVKGGWGLEVPCLDVGSTGTFEYFIQAYDDKGDLAVQNGSLQEPNTVAIVSELSGEPPHLPGRPPPAQCREVSDCPPDFPGCSGGDTGKTADARKPPPSGPEKNWVGAVLQQDVMLLSRTSEVCAEGSDYACFYGDDSFYDVVPRDGSGGELAGGLNLATTRLLAGYDRVLGDNVTLGGRVGYAVGGGPQAPGGKAFVPVHAEARAAYFFGAAPFEREGLRPFVGLSGGMAQVDSKVAVTVFDNQQRFDANQRTKLDAWRKAGTGFASIGGGAAFAVTAEHALAAEIRFMQMFGEPASVLALNVGYAFGL